MAIGSKEKSIKPLGLRKYDALLNCAEVRRRVSPNADREALAQCASEVIRATVMGISERIPRLIAQAALCTEDIYEGLRVTQREEMLEELPERISKEMFKYHRRKAFERIVMILDAKATITTSQRSHSSHQTHRYLTMSGYARESSNSITTDLMQSAARLYYMMLSGIFVTRFSLSYLRGLPMDLPTLSDTSLTTSNAYAKPAFDSFIHFMRKYSQTLLHSFGKDQLATHLPSEALEFLTGILRTIWESGPCFATVDLWGSRPPELETFDIWVSRIHLEPWRTEAFEKLWQPWFFNRTLAIWLPSTARLEPIAAKAGAAAFIIGRYAEFHEPIFSDARRMAHKSLAYYFEFDEFAPIFDGKSFRQHADAYFDSVDTKLASREVVWHDSKTK